MIINERNNLNESNLDVSGIIVDPQPFSYQGFNAVTLKFKDHATEKFFDNNGNISKLANKLGYEIQMSGLPDQVRVNIKNKDFKSAYNDIKNKLNNLKNESISKSKVNEEFVEFRIKKFPFKFYNDNCTDGKSHKFEITKPYPGRFALRVDNEVRETTPNLRDIYDDIKKWYGIKMPTTDK